VSKQNSYRQILRSSSITGGASVINILVGLLRIKVAAVVLGPAGVGLIGLLQSLMGAASSVFALGFGAAGTRQIAEAAGRDDAVAIATVRRALFWGTLGLSLTGGLFFWAFRDVLANQVLKDSSMAGAIGWLAAGVALMIASGSQGALLNGLRRVGDLARLSVASSLLSAALGITSLWLWGERGLVVFVLAGPLASFVLGHWYVSRLPAGGAASTPVRVLAEQWKTLARLGFALMVSGVVVTVGHLVMRTLVQRELGAAALGQFQAAWTIAMTYIGFVLGAMGTDYYPRLTAAIEDHAAANALVNEQSEVALLLAGPVFLAMLGLAPWIIELLYSSEFGPAVAVLRWQVLGDVLKIVSWPLGFIILAAGDGRTYVLTESLAIGAFAGLSWIGMPLMGVEATGVAFVGMYLLYLPLVYWQARRRTGFVWERSVFRQFSMLVVLALVVVLAARRSQWIAAGLAITAAGGLSFYGLVRLGHLADLSGPLGRIASRIQRQWGKKGVRGE
jgi:O-antigen/teichoic acid export membrane protein